MPPSSPREWHKDSYTLTTCPSAITPEVLNSFFATPEIYWAQPLPVSATQSLINNSINFTLLLPPTTPSSSSPAPREAVGYARLITDYTTFAYLTDVYISPVHQGRGLGKWMIRCVSGVLDEMPHLRRSMLVTGDWEVSVPFYEKAMGMRCIGEKLEGEGRLDRGLAVMVRVGRGSGSWV
ncbi:hypothetical protein BDZ85DRAFT_95069 [Elsinoe ampelina]|uniref:N-acetyltransferase domain-containing protein n=1 Tax=Elsinoe ampelina TaxID=302913 RepID=A0A6A6GE66_9PEZI|nr:hypothetical protein BDZ85DRAFT_95069 [Elsinoe ampelina]